MSKDIQLPPPDEETRRAAEPIQERLEEALAKIDSPEKARAVIERLKKKEEPAVEVAEEDIPPLADAAPDEQAGEAAELVKKAAATHPEPIEEAAAVLETTAEVATVLEGPAYEAVAEQIQAAIGPEQSEKLKRSRRYLWEILSQTPGISWLDRLDTELFLFLNSTTPRSPVLDLFFKQVTFWFISGRGWLIGVALAWPFRRRWASQTLRRIAVPIWVASFIVEIPIKALFRRQRPFIDIVRAIVVGKKPGNWSFPSGHAAAAFAGARMMARCLPRWRALWYGIAGLIGFSRIYLGAHYPGDILSGGLLGAGLAEATYRLLQRLRRNG